jgi:AAA15 family ATPase/GTPase
VQNSKTIKFTPLTAFIGNNGSGKSSIVEARETFQSIVLNGLDEAIREIGDGPRYHTDIY